MVLSHRFISIILTNLSFSVNHASKFFKHILYFLDGKIFVCSCNGQRLQKFDLIIPLNQRCIHPTNWKKEPFNTPRVSSCKCKEVMVFSSSMLSSYIHLTILNHAQNIVLDSNTNSGYDFSKTQILNYWTANHFHYLMCF